MKSTHFLTMRAANLKNALIWLDLVRLEIWPGRRCSSASLAARQHRPTNNEWETGLISFDWVRLNAPTRLTRDGDTTPAAVRRISWFFEVGGSAGMKAVRFLKKTMRNYPKLSWKSTTYDAWPALPIDLNRTAGGFATAPFRPLTSYPKFQ